jgi:hypothetical protein
MITLIAYRGLGTEGREAQLTLSENQWGARGQVVLKTSREKAQ